MRVTNGMLVSNMLRNINNNMSKLEKIQQQSSTGQKIRYASDNPIIATRAVKLQSYLSDLEQLQKNAEDAKSWMDYSESTLYQLGKSMQRIRELTVEAANGTNGGDDRSKILAEIEELESGILEMSNTSYSGRYVFAGYDTDAAPFEMEETSIGERIMYKGKYLDIGAAMAASLSDDDIRAFYMDNMNKLYGQPELLSANYEAFTAASPSLGFTVALDGASQTMMLTDGVNYDLATLQSELQAQLSAAFPAGPGQPDPLIEVGAEDGKLKLTVQDGSSISIESGSLDVKMLGFNSGDSSTAGERQEILYKVSNGSRLNINVEGDEVFGNGDGNVFETLTKLKMALSGETSYKTASFVEGPPAEVVVETHDLDISSLLGDLDTDINRILKARSDLGARTNYVELTINRLEKNNTTFTELLSKNIDADYADVSMRLASAEAAYTAALIVGAKVIQPSLLDFLK